KTGLHLMTTAGNGCSQFDDSGLCKIQLARGTEFLSDTCHFFPRVHMQVGKSLLVSAKASCPEISRIVLSEDNPFALVDVDTDRIPHDMLGGDIDAERERRALLTHAIFVQECQRDDISIE